MSNIPLSVHFIYATTAEKAVCGRWLLDVSRYTTNAADCTCRNCLAVLNRPQPMTARTTTEESTNA